jgi:hypothetical protein
VFWVSDNERPIQRAIVSKLFGFLGGVWGGGANTSYVCFIRQFLELNDQTLVALYASNRVFISLLFNLTHKVLKEQTWDLYLLRILAVVV